MDKNNGDSLFKELSGSSHITSKITEQQNELPSNARIAIPKPTLK